MIIIWHLSLVYFFDDFFRDRKNDNKNFVLFYILLIFSILIILLCFIWPLIDKRSYPTLGEGLYAWYIPFYSSNIELIVFQILNITSIIGIIVSLIKIIKRNNKAK